MKHQPGSTDTHHRNGDLEALDYLGAAAASKVVASSVSYPHEVVRTVMVNDRSGARRSIRHALRIVLARHDGAGVRELYRGFITNLMRAVPSSMIAFTIYESVIDQFHPQHAAFGGGGELDPVK